MPSFEVDGFALPVEWQQRTELARLDRLHHVLQRLLGIRAAGHLATTARQRADGPQARALEEAATDLRARTDNPLFDALLAVAVGGAAGSVA